MSARSSSAALFARFRDRIETKGELHGLMYPWWIAVLSTAGLIGSALTAAGQRDAVWPPAPALLAVVLVALPCLADFVIRPWVPWYVETAFVCAGVGWLLATPMHSGLTDLACGALAVVVGEVTACEGFRRGLASTAASVAVVVAASDTAAIGLNCGEVVLGLVIGSMLHWQMRALAAERIARTEEREHATLAERQRVAHEIHDLVAHSLSVTLLHVTGARRALAEDADIPDAIEALTEAERIGRQAMADIRRTVGVLRQGPQGPGEVRPLPGAGDLERLVDDVRAAGLDVDYGCRGELTGLPDATGLGLYRVVQESLANTTKHAPGAPVTVRLDVGSREVRLTVTNPVLVGVVVGSDGSGLAGMASRAEQLGGSLVVGPTGDRWCVELRVPR